MTEVGKTDYFACAGGSALSNDRSGSINITLTAPGTRYFICNIPGHCTAGMRLAVTVDAGSHADWRRRGRLGSAGNGLLRRQGDRVGYDQARAVLMSDG